MLNKPSARSIRAACPLAIAILLFCSSAWAGVAPGGSIGYGPLSNAAAAIPSLGTWTLALLGLLLAVLAYRTLRGRVNGRLLSNLLVAGGLGAAVLAGHDLIRRAEATAAVLDLHMSEPGGGILTGTGWIRLTNTSGVPLQIKNVQPADGAVVGLLPAEMPSCKVGAIVSPGAQCNVQFVSEDPDGGQGGNTDPPTRTVTFDPSLCQVQSGAPYGQTVGITGTNMMVTSADVNASATGCKVLARGGTAIDAAIAVQAVLGVAEPFASGLAGGSVITYYDAASKKVRTFDGFSAAPATTGGVPDIYKAVAQDVSTTSPYNVCKSGLAAGASISAQQGNTNISARAAGVPGTLKVLDLVYRSYGRTPWNELWDDAIALAEEGFPMTPYMYKTLYADEAGYDDDDNPVSGGSGVPAWINSAGTVKGAPRCKYPDIRARYCDLSDTSQQRPLPVGTTIHNPQLAATMKLVRDGGAAAFYDPQGSIAQALVTKLTSGQLPCKSILPAAGTASSPSVASTIAAIPSLITASDFASYQAVERQPLVGQRMGMTIYTQPAPSFGGVVTLYTLGLLERKGLHQTLPAFNGPEFVHLATEASRLANADRRNIVGDPAYSNIKERVAALLAPAYLDSRAALITSDALSTVPAGGTAEGIPAFASNGDPASYDTMAALAMPAAKGREEDWNTTSNVAIIDGYGNALSMTTTINTHWGAHIEAAGMMINNAMSNFSAGTPGLDVNGYAAYKRPRSSIAPAIAFDAKNKLRLVWGSAGGGPIPDYIVKTFLGHTVYGMDLQEAINQDNWTGQNGVAELEAKKPIAGLVPTLVSTYGNTSSNARATGLTSGLSGIAVDYDNNGFPLYRGAADNRRNGGGSGY